MTRDHPLATRRVEVPAERLERWLANFATRHGDPISQAMVEGWELVAPDGAVAVLVDRWTPGAHRDGDLSAAVEHLTRPRTLGLLLVRKGAHAVGLAEGAELTRSKVDTHYVQGRTKAGGWSQQRYARRRDNQAAKAYLDAAQTAATLLLPALESLDAVVCGGDASGVDEVLRDNRLEPLVPLRVGAVLPTRDPRLAVLQEFVAQARATTVLLNDLA